MSIKNFFILTVLTLLSYNINAQFLSNFKIGAGGTYEGYEIGTLSELSLGASSNEKLSLNLRYARNFEGYYSSFRIGGGFEYRPFKLGRFIPSVGLEYYYYNVDRSFFGIEEKDIFGNFQIPIMLNYELSDKIEIGIGTAIKKPNVGSTSFGLSRFNLSYKF